MGRRAGGWMWVGGWVPGVWVWVGGWIWVGGSGDVGVWVWVWVWVGVGGGCVGGWVSVLWVWVWVWVRVGGWVGGWVGGCVCVGGGGGALSRWRRKSAYQCVPGSDGQLEAD